MGATQRTGAEQLSLQTRKYTEVGGRERYITEVVLGAYNGTIVLLDGKPASGAHVRVDDDIPF